MVTDRDAGIEQPAAIAGTRPWLAVVRRRMPWILLGAVLVQPTGRLIGGWDWRIDLVSHFQGPGLLLTLVVWLLLVRSRPRLSAIFLVVAVFQIEPFLRYEGPNPVLAAPLPAPRLRILMANVLCENEQFDPLIRLVREERPDIIGLVEVTRPWVTGIAALRAEYPYGIEAPNGPRGLVLLFRSPPLAIDGPNDPRPRYWPRAHAAFEFAGSTRHLWLIHPSSPFRRRGVPELESLAGEVAAVQGSRIVIGDMNSSDGSPHFANFLSLTGLRDSRLGFGRMPSWPEWSYVRIPIDHAFVSDDLAVVDRRLGPAIGSDHFPLIVDLAPAASASAASSSR